MADVFVSYAREDRQRVAALVRLLQEQQWSVWWDPQVRTGSQFDREIEDQLDAARCIVVIWSRDSVEREWVRAEAAEGVRRDILVPVLLDTVRIPLAFRRRQAVSLVDWRSGTAHAGLHELLASIGALLGRREAPVIPTAPDVATHAARLRAGAQVWNDWRAANPSAEPNLSGANLRALDLSRANLAGTNLSDADLSLATLNHADLHNAILAGANLSESRLQRANFKDADLTRTDLHRAVFEGTILLGAKLLGARQLETTFHLGRSHIDHRALSDSPGLPPHFLRGCGLTDADIEVYEQQQRRG